MCRASAPPCCRALAGLIAPLSHFCTELTAAASTAAPLPSSHTICLGSAMMVDTLLLTLIQAAVSGQIRLSEADALRLGSIGSIPLQTHLALLHDMALRSSDLDSSWNHFTYCCQIVSTLLRFTTTPGMFPPRVLAALRATTLRPPILLGWLQKSTAIAAELLRQGGESSVACIGSRECGRGTTHGFWAPSVQPS